MEIERDQTAFLAYGTDELGAALPPIDKMARAKINVIAADAVVAGKGRFGMLFWVAPRDYKRAGNYSRFLLEAGFSVSSCRFDDMQIGAVLGR